MAFPQRSWEEGQRFVITEELFWLWVIKLFINVTALSFLDLGKKNRNKEMSFLGHLSAYLTETQKYSPEALNKAQYSH